MSLKLGLELDEVRLALAGLRSGQLVDTSKSAKLRSKRRLPLLAFSTEIEP